MSNMVFTDDGWEDYLYWQTQDKKTLKKINKLLKNIQREPFSGEGRPEPLKNHEGDWSRRINEKDRLVVRGSDPLTSKSRLVTISKQAEAMGINLNSSCYVETVVLLTRNT